MPDDLDIRGLVLGVESDLIALRRQLHAWPELAGAEVKTSEVIRRRLRDVGLEPQSLLLPTGLYCDIGTGPATVALRADLDALAMPDGTDTAYSSRIDGVAHACGHDVHTAILVGATLVLAEVLPAGAGVRAVFEPAEESVPGGAYDIVRGGLLDGITAIVGLHCEPKLEVGTIGLRAGAMTAAADMVSITLTGPGGHTARPELTVDLVTLLSRVAAELPRLIEEKDPLLRLVFGSIVAGEAANVIPVDGTLRGTLRTRDRSSWQGAPEIVESCLSGLVRETRATWTVAHRRGVPPVMNDVAVTDVVRTAAARTVGADGVVEVETSMGGDSFAWYTETVPGTYVRLGVHTPGTPALDLHAGTFDVDERAIATGVELLVRSALALL